MGATCNICKQKPQTPDNINANSIQALKQTLDKPLSFNQIQKQIRTHGVLPHLGQFLDSVSNQLLKTISKIDQEYGEFIWEPQQQGTFMLPPCKYSEDGVYVGSWKNHKRQGNGTMFFQDGSCFQGNWNADSAQGFGRLYHSNGDMHQGIYKDNKPNGPGQYKKKSLGANFIGTFLQDKIEGEGKEQWKDGTVFKGNYVNGLKNGYGKFKWSDGNSYAGNFVNNKMEGYGEYRWAAQKLDSTPMLSEKTNPKGVRRIYRGGWKNGLMHGHGSFEWEDKRKYVGNYINDLKEGEGRFQWGDGRIYEGEWKGGLMHGNGKFTDKYGTTVTGAWVKGCLIKSK